MADLVRGTGTAFFSCACEEFSVFRRFADIIRQSVVLCAPKVNVRKILEASRKTSKICVAASKSQRKERRRNLTWKKGVSSRKEDRIRIPCRKEEQCLDIGGEGFGETTAPVPFVPIVPAVLCPLSRKVQSPQNRRRCVYFCVVVAEQPAIEIESSAIGRTQCGRCGSLATQSPPIIIVVVVRKPQQAKF